MRKTKTATFPEGLMLALFISLTGSIIHFLLSPVFSDSFLSRLLIGLISITYILYLLSRSKQTRGRFIVVLSWSVITVALWLLKPPIMFVLSGQLLIIWLVRSLYFYDSLFSAVFDLALQLLSVSAALWAASHSENLFLSLWCFFLTQALFVFIPIQIKKTTRNKSPGINTAADFQHSFRVAETAIRQLSIRH